MVFQRFIVVLCRNKTGILEIQNMVVDNIFKTKLFKFANELGKSDMQCSRKILNAYEWWQLDRLCFCCFLCGGFFGQLTLSFAFSAYD